MIPIQHWKDISPDELLKRRNLSQSFPDAEVQEILDTVRREGDSALRDYALKFDGVHLAELEVTEEEIVQAWNTLDEPFRDALRTAANHIRHFHEKQLPRDYVLTDTPGMITGLRHTPVERVGICVPGSPETFPSTVLMNMIPACTAGVREIVMVTPPGKNGEISPQALGAVYIAAGMDGKVSTGKNILPEKPAGEKISIEKNGERSHKIDTAENASETKVRVFRTGGAQAVAALAYGTQSIPAVDKIVGPGGRYVAAAKRLVSGTVGIDMFAGPSEILVLADGASNPCYVAADMLSQAEHDVCASAVLVTDSLTLAQSVQRELELQLRELPRENVARKSLENNGAIFLAESLEQALDAVNRIAPEHLELCVDDPFALLPRVRNAGSVFLGRYAPEALGDYMAGPNHTLPTAGTARFSSPLGVYDFLKRSSFTCCTRDALEKISDKIALLAECEGLCAHARSVLVRREDSMPDTDSGTEVK